jgi:ATP-dependent helicase/nuclease subunit B
MREKEMHGRAMRADANVFTIPPGTPFLETLVKACLDGSLGFDMGADANDLSAATIYVPTRRAARALTHAFTEALRPHALLLPRVVPLGDPADLEENALLGDDFADFDSAIPPAIPLIDRQLALSRLVEGWRSSGDLAALSAAGDGFTLGGSFGDSFALAGELGRLIDEFALEGIDWGAIDALAPLEFDDYWRLTRDFLAIAGQAWPAYLAERGLLDPAERLNRQLHAAAARMRAAPPVGPVIAAGSTGSVPATAALLATIARLPLGAVVLPGLDTEMDEQAWQLVAEGAAPEPAQPGHPQAMLKTLLHRMDIGRANVGVLSAAGAGRARIVHASMRAADATEAWPTMRAAFEAELPAALEDVSVVEARDEREEALAIAVALRGALEQPGKTAALITPDRALAARVVSELKRWGLSVDDSAGQPLALLPAGHRARLMLKAAAPDARPVDFLALLHALPHDPGALEAVELAGLQNHDIADGPDGWSRALEGAEQRRDTHYAPKPLKRVTCEALQAARALVSGLRSALEPLVVEADARRPIGAWARDHSEVAARLSQALPDDMPDTSALNRLLDQLVMASTQPLVCAADYAAVFEQMCSSAAVVSGTGSQGRIKIFGLLEARLIPAHVVVLGGLNERTWPSDARTDPFLNRAMRAQLGLSSPERRIGQSAHDFSQALGTQKVLLTRAATVEGTPMVASRFLRRLDTFIGADAAKAMRARANWLVEAAHALDESPLLKAAPRPAPKPSREVQPPSLSITEIATLYRDPYAIYARHVLDLAPLPPLDAEPDARDKGTIIHEALAVFITEASANWPADPLARLLEIGAAVFQPLMARERTAAFWWPVFTRMAESFVIDEQERRAGTLRSVVETRATLPLTLGDGTVFTLRGKPDRIDVLADGGLAIIDYKTGAAPSGPQVFFNLEPQLTLAAAMALKGAFAGVDAREIKEISYARVGADYERKAVSFARTPGKDQDMNEIALGHLSSLVTTLDRLRSGTDAFTARRMPRMAKDTGDYDHLARTSEWVSESDSE